MIQKSNSPFSLCQPQLYKVRTLFHKKAEVGTKRFPDFRSLPQCRIVPLLNIASVRWGRKYVRYEADAFYINEALSRAYAVFSCIIPIQYEERRRKLIYRNKTTVAKCVFHMVWRQNAEVTVYGLKTTLWGPWRVPNKYMRAVSQFFPLLCVSWSCSYLGSKASS